MAALLCVFNPKSRHGAAAARVDDLQQLFDQMGVKHTILDLTAAAFPEQLYEQVSSQQFEAILGIGGDGTHHSIINVLASMHAEHPAQTFPPYSMLACGTGNDVAKSIGLKVKPRFDRQAVETALYGELRHFDLGCTAGTRFVDMLSLGLDAQVLATRDRWQRTCVRKQLPGFISGYKLYAAAGLVDLCRFRCCPCRISVDDNLWYEGPAANILINNCPVHAGEFALTPGCEPDDGRLDVLVTRSRLSYLWQLARAYRHNPACLQPTPDRRHLTQGQRIRIQTERPLPMQLDGEYQDSCSRVDIDVQPGILPIRTPAN